MRDAGATRAARGAGQLEQRPCTHQPYLPHRATMLAASALSTARLAARPAPTRLACRPQPGVARPSIVAAATPDPSKACSQPQAAAATLAALAAASALLLAHPVPALAEDGGRSSAAITAPPTLDYPGQLDAPAAPRAPGLGAAPQDAPGAGASETDIAQASPLCVCATSAHADSCWRRMGVVYGLCRADQQHQMQPPPLGCGFPLTSHPLLAFHSHPSAADTARAQGDAPQPPERGSRQPEAGRAKQPAAGTCQAGRRGGGRRCQAGRRGSGWRCQAGRRGGGRRRQAGSQGSKRRCQAGCRGGWEHRQAGRRGSQGGCSGRRQQGSRQGSRGGRRRGGGSQGAD